MYSTEEFKNRIADNRLAFIERERKYAEARHWGEAASKEHMRFIESRAESKKRALWGMWGRKEELAKEVAWNWSEWIFEYIF